MFEKFETADEMFSYKLGSALKMEHTVLGMLGKLQQETHRDELRQQLAHHADETRQQISNVERAFATLDEQPDENVDLVIEAIDKEGRANVKRTQDNLVDVMILAGVAATEHHEIAVYEWLITEAKSLGHNDIAGMLQQNLEQEQHTLGEVMRATEKVAQETAATG
jgi:ferritin-like metal-binding protein YciE